MKNESDFSTDPELEARVVAWVLGEASPFEAAELERRVAADPQLASFKRRIEAVHGLLGQAVTPQTVTLRLSAECRAKLLAVIGEPVAADEPRPSVLSLPLLHQEKRWRLPLWAYSATAACLLVGVFVVATLPRFGMVKPTAAALQRAKLEVETGEEMRKRENTIASYDAKRREAEDGARASARSVASMLAAPPAEADADTERAEARLTARAVDAAPAFADKPAIGITAPQVKLSSNAGSLLAGALQTQAIAGKTGSYGGAASPTFDYYNSAGKPAGTLDVSATSVPSSSSVEQSDAVRIRGDDGSEIVRLSPFEVRADAEQGYAAASTLAGSRVRTTLPEIDIPLSVSVNARLADTASTRARAGRTNTDTPTTRSWGLVGHVDKDAAQSVSVVTKEFLRDTGATDNTSMLAFTGNDAVAGVKKDPAMKHTPAPPAVPGPLGEAPLSRAELGETLTQKQAVSTFSLHVSDVSFKLAQAALAKGEKPDPAAIRPEEFYNAFDYGDPSPIAGEPVACRIEQAAHPVLQQRNLVRIALRVPAVGREATQALRLTVLLDTSGSMEREDRVATIRRAFEVLASLLGAQDRVTVIGFARQPRLIAKDVPGNEARKLVELVTHTPTEGGTNFEEALKLAAEQARGQFAALAQNRIVVLSDGAANLGNDNPAQLASEVAALRQEGISFDACGVGIDGLDDSVLEALTRKGDGRYYAINTPEDADAGFARKLAGALHPAAQNVKVQVRFNPARVQSYRLIGFEQHRLREEDFRNDKVTAAELAGSEAAVAVYEVQPKPEGEGELGDVFVRFRNTATGAMVERSWTLRYDPQVPSFDRASPSLQLAGLSALLAEKLQGRETGAQVRLAELAPIVNQVRGAYAHDRRVQEFVAMFEQARRLYGE